MRTVAAPSWRRRGSAALPAGGAVGGLLAFAGEHLKGSLWQHRHSGAGDSGRSFCVAAEGRCQACGRLHPGLVPGVRPAQAAGGQDVLGDVEPGVQGGQQRPDAGRTHLGTLLLLPSAGAWSGRFSREKIPGLCAAHGRLSEGRGKWAGPAQNGVGPARNGAGPLSTLGRCQFGVCGSDAGPQARVLPLSASAVCFLAHPGLYPFDVGNLWPYSALQQGCVRVPPFIS